MDLDGSKRLCGICRNWQGRREYNHGLARMKPSARGNCVLLNILKPPHGGCNEWKKWEGEEVEKQ